ncbi:hypothetical protein [Streptomyces sp. SPB162]|nr:hypothetical protein [Streptomyces sp. SPB162]
MAVCQAKEGSRVVGERCLLHGSADMKVGPVDELVGGLRLA